jgi:hypothetical protein
VVKSFRHQSYLTHRRQTTTHRPGIRPGTASVLLDAVMRAAVPPTPADLERGRRMLARYVGPDAGRSRDMEEFRRGLAALERGLSL